MSESTPEPAAAPASLQAPAEPREVKGPKLTGKGGPIVGLTLVALGGYLTWFAVRYWRGQGQAVWPSYPIKKVLQGKGLPGNQPATSQTAQLASFEQSYAGGEKTASNVGPLTAATATLPENARPIYEYLRGKGFSQPAAAGWVGNIAQESGGSPEAGSYPSNWGLIQWTPAPSYVQPTGHPLTDLARQLHGIIIYVMQNGSIRDINANASSPAAAAKYISDKYERPNAQLANNPHREEVANEVAKQSWYNAGVPVGNTAGEQAA